MLSRLKEIIALPLRQHKDILIFMLVIVSFHAFWKIGRETDENEFIILFYGIDFTPFFSKLCEFWTKIVYATVACFKNDFLEKQYCLIHYSDTDTGIRILWGCSGVKEILMTILAITFAKGNYHKKLWYIPISIVGIILLNYIRLTTLSLLVHHHSECFDFVHKVIFRIFMYGGIFLFWLFWNERIKTNK